MNKSGITLIIVFACTLFSCKKEPTTYTYKMAGNHTWRRIINDTDTTYTLVFDRDIVVLNSYTIVFPSPSPTMTDTMKYSGSKNKTLIFTSQYIVPSYSSEYDTMHYDYAKNTLEFVEYSTYKGISGFIRLYTP